MFFLSSGHLPSGLAGFVIVTVMIRRPAKGYSIHSFDKAQLMPKAHMANERERRVAPARMVGSWLSLTLSPK